jgi:hypothetical protein
LKGVVVGEEGGKRMRIAADESDNVNEKRANVRRFERKLGGVIAWYDGDRCVLVYFRNVVFLWFTMSYREEMNSVV